MQGGELFSRIQARGDQAFTERGEGAESGGGQGKRVESVSGNGHTILYMCNVTDSVVLKLCNSALI